MYRLVLYTLASLIFLAGVLSLIGRLPYDAVDIILSTAYLILTVYLVNLLFAKIVSTRANPESAFITGLILALIVGPVPLFDNLLTLTFFAAVASASKYILVWRRKHIFNPAALAAVAGFLVLGQGATWWVGAPELTWLVVILGLLVLKKTGRFGLVFAFLITYLSLTIVFNINAFSSLESLGTFIWRLLLYSPILFFAFIMLTEPQTSPKKTHYKIIYGLLVGLVLVLYQKYLTVPYTLELALLSGNLFAYAVTRDTRINLNLKQGKEIAQKIFSFSFTSEKKIHYQPGQFMEWTLYHPKADSRGLRRYFTIASSPTEQDVLLTVKIPEQSSTFKKALNNLPPGETVISSGIDGNFTLPEEKKSLFWRAVLALPLFAVK